ncbi:class I SAM-dependent methyltransferase [Aeromonas caviae]|uniref:Class I SAM-dependent methyltransferase n=1 Tax=Aeromonas caviae TaxID=648 RepID=A0A7T3X6A0_AERCA|nr:class I SAM-dependent methyltransferase [Aeromonas caviae]MDX7858826.1 class I SAM-dependent methyltransferase [Aeromonas caviae]MEA9435138.1 class I SAM-dependent methyltransferase [Aeromonas caviae]QQA63022.1 class I SAM-dependent methyltransferase [Aeromonas caviae]
MHQKNVFMDHEGDEWYKRNKAAILDKSLANDPIFKALEYLGSRPARILEIGCANGWRLAQLAEHYGARCYGVDPSASAIQDGLSRYPGLQLTVGTADCLPEIEPVDLIIFGFCLYLCDPQDLFKIAAGSDALLADRGLMTILDFNPPAGHYRNDYQHHANIFSYKMNYGELFGWHPGYHHLFEHVQHHDGGTELEPDALISVQILRKDARLLAAQNPYPKG